MRSIPVLMYHHVLPKAGFIASAVEQFEAQMRFLAENQWHTLTSEEFAAFKRREFSPPKKSLLITFDDGWRDNAVYAYPILRHYGLKATMFLVTEWVEKASQAPETYEPLQHKECKNTVPRHPGKVIVNWDEVASMQDVFDFHSHTHTHADGYFETIPWEEEFTLSKEMLKKRLDIDSRHLCWPRGRYDSSLIALAGKAGFDILYTTKRGINVANGESETIYRLAAKKEAQWLQKNLRIFSNALIGKLYASVKPE